MAKNKFYVVWQGREKGIFSSWNDCKKQVDGYEGAQYKGFPTQAAAELAYSHSYWQSVSSKKDGISAPVSYDHLPETEKPNRNAIAVDAACSGNPGKMEYRGVDVMSGAELFRIGPYEDGTNNVGEFLALVHGLALLKQMNSNLPVYSDSRNAILWVKQKKCKTKLDRTAKNAKIFELIQRAEKWLAENKYSTEILKWETKVWGEIPADFGRK